MSDLMAEVMSGFQSNKPLTEDEAKTASITAATNYMITLEKVFKRGDNIFTEDEQNALDKYFDEWQYFKNLYTTTKE